MEDEETEEDAMDRITEEITERFETDVGNVDEVMEALTEAKVPHFTVRANDRLTRIRYRLLKVRLRYSIGETVDSSRKPLSIHLSPVLLIVDGQYLPSSNHRFTQ